jgi:2,4-dienoyl-CoA reductase-like NADH-dependent reductase (Old Yellow Enzyme family)
MKPFANVVSRPITPMSNYNVEAAQTIKAKVGVPVIVVGGIASLTDIADIVEHEKADFVSMCRPFIIEPNIVQKFLEGKQESSRCIRCNYCMIAAEERPLRCYHGKLKE